MSTIEEKIEQDEPERIFQDEEDLEGTREAYYLIGKFTIYFQKMLWQLQFMINWEFKRIGLHETQYLNIFFDRSGATDYLDIAWGLMNQVFKPTEEEKAITNKIFDRIKDIITFRNDIHHGLIFIGSLNKEGFYPHSNLRITKKPSKGWYYKPDLQFDNMLLKEKLIEVQELYASLWNITTYFIDNRMCPEPSPKTLQERMKTTFSG